MEVHFQILVPKSGTSEVKVVKKLLSACCALALLLSLTSCGGVPAQSSAASSSGQYVSSSAAGSETDEPEVDPHAIPGMGSYAIRHVLSGAPFEVPYTTANLSSVEGAPDTYACVSCSNTDGAAVMYDYSLTLSADETIIGASFGITGTTASAQELLTAADLYFYAISLIKYDTANTEELTSWFASSLPDVGETAIETTIGDATFKLWGIPGAMYWVDISKA